MAFQFVAFDHSFSTLVVLPLFFSQNGLSIYGLSPFILNIGGPSNFFFNMAFHFVAFDHSSPTLVAFQFFLKMAVHFVDMTIHSQRRWPFHFFFLNMAFHLWLLTIHSQDW
jgi:hypothetical protein